MCDLPNPLPSLKYCPGSGGKKEEFLEETAALAFTYIPSLSSYPSCSPDLSTGHMLHSGRCGVPRTSSALPQCPVRAAASHCVSLLRWRWDGCFLTGRPQLQHFASETRPSGCHPQPGHLLPSVPHLSISLLLTSLRIELLDKHGFPMPSPWSKSSQAQRNALLLSKYLWIHGSVLLYHQVQVASTKLLKPTASC